MEQITTGPSVQWTMTSQAVRSLEYPTLCSLTEARHIVSAHSHRLQNLLDHIYDPLRSYRGRTENRRSEKMTRQKE